MKTKLLAPTIAALLLGVSNLAFSEDWDRARGHEYRDGPEHGWKHHGPRGWHGHRPYPRRFQEPRYYPPVRHGYWGPAPYRHYPPYAWDRPGPYRNGVTIIYRGHF